MSVQKQMDSIMLSIKETLMDGMTPSTPDGMKLIIISNYSLTLRIGVGSEMDKDPLVFQNISEPYNQYPLEKWLAFVFLKIIFGGRALMNKNIDELTTYAKLDTITSLHEVLNGFQRFGAYGTSEHKIIGQFFCDDFFRAPQEYPATWLSEYNEAVYEFKIESPIARKEHAKASHIFLEYDVIQKISSMEHQLIKNTREYIDSLASIGSYWLILAGLHRQRRPGS